MYRVQETHLATDWSKIKTHRERDTLASRRWRPLNAPSPGFAKLALNNNNNNNNEDARHQDRQVHARRAVSIRRLLFVSLSRCLFVCLLVCASRPLGQVNDCRRQPDSPRESHLAAAALDVNSSPIQARAALQSPCAGLLAGSGFELDSERAPASARA